MKYAEDPTKKTVEHVKFKIPNIHLDYFSNDKKDILLDHLVKSSEWHVFPVYGTIIAKYRGKNNHCEDKKVQDRYIPSKYSGSVPDLSGNFINLYPDRNKHPERIQAMNEATENSNILLKRVRFRIYKQEPSDGDIKSDTVNTDIIVNSNNKKIAVFASQYNSTQASTTSFLDLTSKKLNQLADLSEKGDSLTKLSILPPKSTIVSPRQLVNIDKLGWGAYNVYGYINTTQKGFIYLKVI